MLYRYFQIKNQFYVISEIDFTHKLGLDPDSSKTEPPAAKLNYSLNHRTEYTMLMLY